MIVLFLGPPGAGKGTQAHRIVEEFDLKHVSSGDLLRAERAGGSDLGDKVAGCMDAGQLVPDEMITEVILAYLAKDTKSRVLLDGFPRTVNQAECLATSLAQAGRQVNIVVELTASDDSLVDRIVGRRVCPECNAVYHMVAHPPKAEGVCDQCGTALMQRPDDTEPVIRDRLKAYHEQTKPLSDWYDRAGLLSKVNGNLSVDAVTDQVRKVMRSVDGIG
jgi:adenylate kinase